MSAIQLLVGNSASLTADDTSVRDRLQTTLGHTVTVKNYTAAVNTTGIDLLVIADSVAEGSTQYKSTAVPVLAFSDWTQLGLSAADNTSVTANSSIVIDNSASPLAAGLTGTASVYNTSQSPRSWFQAGWGTGFGRVASSAATATRVVLASYASGATLQDGTAAAGKRVAYGLRVTTAYSANGWAVFDASVAYLLPAPSAPVTIDVPALGLPTDTDFADVYAITTLTASVISIPITTTAPTIKWAQSYTVPTLSVAVDLDAPGLSTPTAVTAAASDLSITVDLDVPVVTAPATLTIPALDVALNTDTVVVTAVITVTVPALDIALDQVAPAVSATSYWFGPPTRPHHLAGVKALRRYVFDEGLTVVMVNGHYVTRIVAADVDPSSLVEGVDFFLGGKAAVPVSAAVKEQLEADGYTVLPFNPDEGP